MISEYEIRQIISTFGAAAWNAARKEDSLRKIRAFIAQYNEPERILNQESEFGHNTLLSFAAELEYWEIVEIFIHVPGVDVNKGRPPPLMSVVYDGSKEMVGFLLGLGADVNIVDLRSRSRTPLMQLLIKWQDVRKDREDIFNLLINHPNINFDVRDENGKTALDLAETNFSKYFAEKLRKKIAEKNATSSSNTAPSTTAPSASSSNTAPSTTAPSATPPHDFLDPITLELLEDPIVVSSGKAYGRASLREYWNSLGRPDVFPCPMTRLPIRKEEINNFTCTIIKNQIDEYKRTQQQQQNRNTDSAGSNNRTFRH